MSVRKPAPRFLNLFLIKLPPSGVVSIAHRISGVLMFVSIPVIAYLFALSLESRQGFEQVRVWLASPAAIVLTVLLVWSFSHHLLAGVRHLLLDIEIGVQRAQARTSAWLVNLGALLLTAIYLAVGVL
ncbi:MAG: succinate dehydrogenase, cytochrome b556 subunit [Gammaproteobacteria bacterium]|nr:MAG: succinate dehydrogenase, cytochrome b556 subunit [Gammaproteobacteria bacterium]